MTGRARVEARSLSPAPKLDLRAIAAGVLTTFLLTVLASAIMAVAIYWSDLTEAHVSGALFYVGLLAVAIGGAVASRRAGSFGWLHGGLAGFLYVFLSIVLGAVLFPGSQVLPAAAGKLALGALSGVVGGVAGINL